MPDTPTTSAAATSGRTTTGTGLGRVIVLVYGVLALAATGRSIMQIASYFDRAPLAYSLSALAALIYLVATVALAVGRRRLATAAIVIELVGVLVVGVLSYVTPSLFPDKTVWSHFGAGYGYVPLVLPILGLWWVRRGSRAPH